MTGTSETADASAPKVFISYRREETAAYAGRLYDTVAEQYGQGNVFMDLDLAPGIDFVDRITHAVGSCQVLIVVMGPRWSTVQDEDGKVRIAEPEDYVRLEVESALDRSDVTVIPVLVGGAGMPDREELPTNLQPITRRNALELSDARWRYDVGRLTTALDQILSEVTGVHVPPALPVEAAPPALPTWRLIVEAALVGAVVALLAFLVGDAIYSGGHGDTHQIVRSIVLRGETWALTGAAVGIWLAVRRGDVGIVRGGVTGLLIGALGGALGGAVYAVPNFSSALGLSDTAKDAVDVAGFAVTAGFLGALLGSLWRPRRLGVGMLSGIVVGAVVELILRVPLGSSGPVAYGIRGAVVVAAVVGLLALLDAQESPAVAGDDPGSIRGA